MEVNFDRQFRPSAHGHLGMLDVRMIAFLCSASWPLAMKASAVLDSELSFAACTTPHPAIQGPQEVETGWKSHVLHGFSNTHVVSKINFYFLKAKIGWFKVLTTGKAQLRAGEEAVRVCVAES